MVSHNLVTSGKDTVLVDRCLRFFSGTDRNLNLYSLGTKC